jgi:hypothetical protein
MRSTIFIILTLAKVGVIIFFFARVLKNLVKKNDPNSKRKAVIQCLSMFGALIGLTILEFGMAYLIPSDS